MNNQLVSSSSFCSPPSWKYDVFLSFRGEDTRTNFTDHLYKALDDKGIDTFIDRQLRRGEEISPALLEAIEESRISIIVFSENYASSRWCLDELVHILECRKSRQQIVWPVFYKVDPSDVRKQTSNFGDAFTKLKCKFEDNQEKILTWTSALRDAANLSGHTFKEGEYEATFIGKIVNEILVLELQCLHLSVAEYQVGMESCVEKVKELLDGGNDPCVVGIWGASGIGKTEVAKTVYNAIAYEFEGRCFLAGVREKSMQYEGLLQLQNILLSEIGGSEWKAVDLHRGNSLIEKLLRRKKILLILDDVDDLGRLSNLVQVKWLGEGSRVIITTKDKGLLESYDVKLIYEVQKLEDNKAIELFSWNAFGEEKPPDDYLGLARRAIAYAQGLPLALNLIGSQLRGKNIVRWQDILDSYDEEPHRGIQSVLRKSYDTLECVQQHLFLDIACFFKGEDKDKVLQILKGSNLKVRQHCIDVLVENAIITIEDNRILMHDLLEQMGKHIVWEESPTEPGKRSRLWHPKDVYRVLTKNRGTRKIKGIVVKLPVSDVIPLNTKSFSKMVNLEFFIIHNAHFSGCVEYLPDDLRWIEFGGLHYRGSNILQKHILTFNLQSNCHLRNLVTFIMPNSDIKQLKVFQERETLLGFALSFVLRPSFPPLENWGIYDCISGIHINEASDYREFEWEGNVMETAHVRLMFVVLEKKKKQGDICKVKFQFLDGENIEMCGVHPLFRKEDGRLPLSLGATSSLGSSDIVDDEYDRQQQWPSLSSNPADDHPKRTQIDHNVPSDIEEEQEQPSTISWGARIKSCGVHPVLRKEDEWLPLSLGPTSSLGKRPRPLGSSDTVHEEYDRQRQWLALSSNPADDHPKRRQIDLNVPFDFEEGQEQPSTSDDSQFFLH